MVGENRMENLILAINVVLPILIILTIGYVLKYFNMVDTHSLNKMNSLVFRVFMSSLLFINIYRLDAEAVFQLKNLRFILFPVLGVFCMIFLSYLVYSRTIKDSKKCSVMIQAAYRGNFVLFGIPIASTLYGEEALGITSLLLAAVIPTFNLTAILLLEFYRGEKIKLSKLVSSTYKNPLLLASTLAIICLLLDIHIPNILEVTISSLAKVATPLAFIVLGGSLEMKSVKKHWKYLLTANIVKLLVFPFFLIVASHFLSFTSMEITAFLAATACPAAVASFTMAKEMDADGDLAGEIVVTTSAFSIVTIFFWVLILKNIAWI